MDSHQSFNADCFDILPNIPSESVDFIFADLPYGTTQNKWDTPIDLAKLWPELNRVCKRNAAMVFTCQQPFTTTLIASNIKAFRYEWIWEKTHATGHLNAKKMPMKAHENIAVFYHKLPTYNPQKTSGHKEAQYGPFQSGGHSENYGEQKSWDRYKSTERYPRSVLKFKSVAKGTTSHPTQKPQSLIEYMIKTYTNPGEMVLDPTAGVLTTRRAAQATDRRSITIELDTGYYEKGLSLC